MPTLADLLRTPGTPANTVKTTLADLFRGYNREAVAGLLGAPVDLANTVSNLTRAGIGYTGHKLGLLASPPDLIEKPALGSDWIYERLPRQPALTGSTAENVGRGFGALLSPVTAVQAAPAAIKRLAGILQEKVPGMAEGYLRGMGGQLSVDDAMRAPWKVDRENLGYSHGQTDAEFAVWDGKNPMGYASVAIFDKKPHIQMIETFPEYRGKGVAEAIVREIANQHGGYGNIKWGMLTPEGAALKAALDKKFQ